MFIGGFFSFRYDVKDVYRLSRGIVVLGFEVYGRGGLGLGVI